MNKLEKWKAVTLNTYYYSTMPFRMWSMWMTKRAHRSPVIVLFFHRVADGDANGWTIPTDLFDRQIQWLAKRYDLVTLEEAQQRLRYGFNQRPALSITFDDGYADNMRDAIPILLNRGIPFTYFVSSHYVLHRRPFPHDVELGKPLKPNSVEDLKTLVDAGVEIGAHSRTHIDLGPIRDSARLYDEIAGSREDLESALKVNVRYFAFPYGQHRNLNPESFAVAREAGFQGVCSAYGGYNLPGEDPFHLQRIHADHDFVRFKNWLTMDPRKKLIVERYDYRVAKSQRSLAGAATL